MTDLQGMVDIFQHSGHEVGSLVSQHFLWHSSSDDNSLATRLALMLGNGMASG